MADKPLLKPSLGSLTKQKARQMLPEILARRQRLVQHEQDQVREQTCRKQQLCHRLFDITTRKLQQGRFQLDVPLEDSWDVDDDTCFGNLIYDHPCPKGVHDFVDVAKQLQDRLQQSQLDSCHVYIIESLRTLWCGLFDKHVVRVNVSWSMKDVHKKATNR